ncbi:unnamed protein product [Rotaria magnacalcarata]
MSEKKVKSTVVGAASKTATSNDMRPRRRMVQNYLIIWIDGNINLNNCDCQNTLEQLRTVVNEVKLCTTPSQCIEILNEIDDGKVFIISSGALCQHLVPDIHEMPTVDAIYIFGDNKANHEQLAKEWTKIRGVFTSIEPICESLKKVARHCDHDSIPMSFVPKQMIATNGVSQQQNLDQLEPSYMYSMLFKDIMLGIHEDDTKPLNNLVIYCREQGVSQYQLNYFQDKYHEKSAIWWYTEEIFIYSMLNKALRSLDMECMVKMGFFIRKLHQQLEQLHQEQLCTYEKKFVVYRGQGMTQEDFQHLIDTKGGLLSFHNFLSTSKERSVAMDFVQRAMYNSDETVGVIFIMAIDQSKISVKTTPFAMIDAYSAIPSEQEILFTMHTVFRVREITRTDKNNRLWEVQLTITGDSDPQLAALTDCIKEEVQGSSGWYRMGKLMLKVGHFKQAEEFYNELLKNTSSASDKGNIYHMLGMLTYQQCNYQEAATLYENSLEIMRKTLSEDDISLANTYNNIALAYQKMGDYSKALEFYEKSCKIKEKCLSPNDPDLATTYSNIGSVYNNMGDYTKALEFYENDLKITKKSLPSNHPDLAASYSNIGSAYSNMGDYAKALEFYEKDLEITKKSLPPNHPDLANSYHNIGTMFYGIGEYAKALPCLEKALSILKKSLSSTHPNIKTVINSIEDVKKKL